MLSCILIFPKVPPDPHPPPILYEYKIANFPETLVHIPKLKFTAPWYIFKIPCMSPVC